MLLKDIIEFKNGKKKPLNPGNIPIYGGNGILGYTDQNNYDGESLIIGRVGAYCGCVYNHYGKCWISDNAIVGKVKENNDFYYCYYLLKMLNLNSRHVGSGQPLITQEILNNIEIDPCNYEEQKKIGIILKNIDDKINIHYEINNNLHEIEKNLYKEMFNDLSDEKTLKLGELCRIKYGKGLPTTKIESCGYPVYGGNGIIGYYHEFMYDDSQVLISCRGAASGNVIISKPKSFVTNNSLILECDRKYHHYLKQYSLDNYYYEYTTGSAQPQITIDNIKDIVIKIPSDDCLKLFNEQMETLEETYFSNLEEIEKLEKLRNTLLPKLMTNKINLDDVEL